MNNCLTRGKTQKFHTNLDYKLYSKISKDNYEDEALFGLQLLEVHLMLHILSIMSSFSRRSCFQIKQGCKYHILNTTEVLPFKALSISKYTLPFYDFSSHGFDLQMPYLFSDLMERCPSSLFHKAINKA